jgi:hypothetical protein
MPPPLNGDDDGAARPAAPACIGDAAARVNGAPPALASPAWPVALTR